jgi:hypothetical protein
MDGPSTCPICENSATVHKVKDPFVDFFEVNCQHCTTVLLFGPLLAERLSGAMSPEDRKLLRGLQAAAQRATRERRNLVIGIESDNHWRHIAQSQNGFHASA